MDLKQMETDDLKAMGFNPDDFTAEQKELILQPSWAPENYMCDGEITAGEALYSWNCKMLKSGIKPWELVKIRRQVFG